MPTPYPKEFRRDVIAVARQGDQSIAQVARSFGISESCLSRWLRIADREDGIAAGSAFAGEDSAELRELRKRNRQLEQRTRSCAGRRPTSRVMCSQNDVPAGRSTSPPNRSLSR